MSLVGTSLSSVQCVATCLPFRAVSWLLYGWRYCSCRLKMSLSLLCVQRITDKLSWRLISDVPVVVFLCSWILVRALVWFWILWTLSNLTNAFFKHRKWRNSDVVSCKFVTTRVCNYGNPPVLRSGSLTPLHCLYILIRNSFALLPYTLKVFGGDT
jgi:hypothetical protein